MDDADFDPVHALSALLEEESVFIFRADDGCIAIALNCNDLFVWGSADSEPILHDDLPILAAAISQPFGLDKWACKRRGCRPQKPVEERMRREGAWDDEMERLPGE